MQQCCTIFTHERSLRGCRYLYSGGIKHPQWKAGCGWWTRGWCGCSLHHTGQGLQQAHQLVRDVCRWGRRVLHGMLLRHWHGLGIDKVWLLRVLWLRWVLLRIWRHWRRRVDRVYNWGEDVCIKYGAPRDQQPPKRELGLFVGSLPHRKKQLLRWMRDHAWSISLGAHLLQAACKQRHKHGWTILHYAIHQVQARQPVWWGTLGWKRCGTYSSVS